MQELKVIENELVPVYETSTGEKVVYGSELHEVLGVKSRYREWIDRRFTDIDAVEKEDYEAAEISAPSGQSRKEHIIKLDTAKEMAMLERNEKGKQVRRYFIAVEKKYKSNALADLSPELRAVIVVDKRVTKIENRMNEFENDIPLFGAESDELSTHVKRKGVEILGGKQSEAYKDSTVRQAVYTDIYNQIKREYGLYDESGKYKSYKALKRKYIEVAHKLVDAYIPPIFLAEQIANCNAQMRMEAV